MIKANYSDKFLIVDILSQSFDKNKSVNYIVKQDAKRADRIKVLMEYSFEMSYLLGDVYLSENKKGCVLLLYPEKKFTSLKKIHWNIKLLFQCIGFRRLFNVLRREALIKSNHPTTSMCYLWFLAVYPEHQKQGTGNQLMEAVIRKSIEEQRDIYLETSTLSNIPWYQKFKFEIVKELDLGYNLFLFRRSAMH